jgi:hypothetical protein
LPYRRTSSSADKSDPDGKTSIIVKKLNWKEKRDKIPTTFVSLAPEKLVIENGIDILVGVFHIMWDDMPRRRTYQIRLSDLVTSVGDYSGTSLTCGNYKDLLEKLESKQFP